MAVNRYATAVLNFRHRPNGFHPWSTGTATFSNFEEWTVANHLPINTNGDSGGAWILHKNLDSVQKGTFSAKTYGSYDGDFTVGGPTSGFTITPNYQKITDSALNALGATAISRTLPNNPAFDMSTSLGELMQDGLPSTIGLAALRERARITRSAGKEYLNVQFGWLPLVRDIQSFAKAVKNSHEILENYRKGSDTKIRRRYDFPANRNSVRMHSGSFFPWNASLMNTFGTGHMSETVIERSWFSGAFRYHIPTSVTQLDKFREWRSNADRLLGVSLTPETLWNIAPWSWAVDWFSNTGDIINNVSSLGKDGLVLQYGYVMNHREVTSHTTASFTLAGETRSTSRTRSDIWKVRLPATPYGFGINLSSLNAKQIAIITALGLSRT